MKNLLRLVAGLALLGWAAGAARSQEAPGAVESGAPAHAPAAHEGASHEGAAHEGATHATGGHDDGPTVPKRNLRWPGVMVFLILILFFMAAVIGPIVRAQAPPEMPPTHSHDEPPGASHHHGHSGTINPVPEDVARIEQGDAHGHGHVHGHDH